MDGWVVVVVACPIWIRYVMPFNDLEGRGREGNMVVPLLVVVGGEAVLGAPMIEAYGNYY